MINIFTIVFVIPLGISYTCTNLVGNTLGRNMPNKARTYSHAGILFGWVVLAIIIVNLILFKNKIIALYTTDEEVTDLVMTAFPFWILFIVFDLSKIVMLGILSAIGYQSKSTFVGVVSYWVIMLPVSYL
mmetsp:Transcript_25017/g.28731  ORF Transcript_25017/g.28731 Transcript_25017/m.28731 type:complete len:130 (+) Transcript_25017:92-481(+)